MIAKLFLAVVVVAALAAPVMAAPEWCGGAYDASKGTSFGRCSDSKPLVGGIQGTGADGGGAGAATGAASGSSGSSGATSK